MHAATHLVDLIPHVVTLIDGALLLEVIQMLEVIRMLEVVHKATDVSQEGVRRHRQ